MSMFPYFVAVLLLAVIGCGCCALLLANWKDKPGPSPRWITCPSCNGTGRNHSSLCIRCNATGQVETDQVETDQVENDWKHAAIRRMPRPDPAAELIAALWNNIWRGNAPVSTDALRQVIEVRTPRSPAIDAALSEVVRRCEEWNVQKSISRGGHGGVFRQVQEAIDQLSLLVTGSPASTKEREFALAVMERLAVPPTEAQIRGWLDKKQ